MKRLMTFAAASAIFAAISVPAMAQMACSNFGRGTRYILDANTKDGTPTFDYALTPKLQVCEGDKDQYHIKDTATKGLNSTADVASVLHALRTLHRTGYTDVNDITKGLKFVDDVEKADAARLKKKVANQGDQGNTKEPFFPFGEPKKK